ncbi:MAG TPA: hypothetical protein VGR31_12240 [Planctomycetota bacterium]|jgi:hypothetical protein|nr:hypothetical protein [Planctomycetota bacterium]
MNPEVLVAVDWSGARSGARRALWLAEIREARLRRLECGRDREELIAHLVALAAREPRLVVGLDFAFSFPAWFLHAHGVATAPEAWELARREGETWLARCEPPFWGRRARPRPDLPPDNSSFRVTESERLPVRGIGPKSVFQIAGTGSVGTGSIRGMPKLRELSDAGFSIWPFDPPRLPMAIEIYPRWLTGRVRKTNEVSRRLHLAVHAAYDDPALVELAASSEHAFDAAASAIAMGLHRGSFLELPRADDPVVLAEGRIWTPTSPPRTGAGTPPAPRPPSGSRAR